ncbi:hypothetical protein HDU93_008790 [Gonapodya sp. JEL0774]|nr:hypothetical protein HDU93_008790 [Gonapodya sp. JEL0774]
MARTFDLDFVLRKERTLSRYFRWRDLGDARKSETVLQAKKGLLDIILSVPDTPETRSSSMHVRLPDLRELATGGDSSLVASEVDDSPDVLKVVAVDSGTYPTGGGGVGSCRSGILWRERLFALCDTDEMPRFVQIAFVGLTRLIAWLVMQRADAINSCTSIQNPMWEMHLGGGKFSDNESKSLLQAKISPVVNGMNVARFKPNTELELSTPTAVMLSHISPVKDIINAIEAANIIVNTLDFKNFAWHIYGSPEKDPGYTAECTSLIASYNLQKHVLLKGLGNPGAVLPTGWVFVNSSITEGLPLALGEAGLCGLPVVCTDVGGSREVISDLKTGVVYGAVAPPSRPRQLAQGILSVLAMIDGLDSIVGESSSLSVHDFIARGPQGMAELESRITNEATKVMRHKLGMMLRERTMQKFSIAKYWRVHEQMLYLGTAFTPSMKVHKKRPTITGGVA